VNGIFLRIPGLWRTENLPKLPSYRPTLNTRSVRHQCACWCQVTISARWVDGRTLEIRRTNEKGRLKGVWFGVKAVERIKLTRTAFF
jgi:hypothetical protein